MFENTTEAVGVDISKAHLDAHRLPSGHAARTEFAIQFGERFKLVAS